MPIDVDVDQRLTDLARATVAVSRRRGVEGVTIRAVAAELGGSTTLVTNYLPTRSALLANAVRHALRHWSAEMDAALSRVEPGERLRAAAHWGTTTDEADAPLRQLIVELVARPALDDTMAPIREDARAERAEYVASARRAGSGEPEAVADAVFLLLRGYCLASLEDPEEWPSDRVDRIVDRVIDAFL